VTQRLRLAKSRGPGLLCVAAVPAAPAPPARPWPPRLPASPPAESSSDHGKDLGEGAKRSSDDLAPQNAAVQAHETPVAIV
jgi:hypothetical protein